MSLIEFDFHSMVEETFRSFVLAALRASLPGKAVVGTEQLLYGQYAERVVENREWVFVRDKQKRGGVDE